MLLIKNTETITRCNASISCKDCVFDKCNCFESDKIKWLYKEIQVVDGKLSGDIPKQYYPYLDNVADYTPVPSGVGLLTRLTLLQHVWNYYKK